MMKPRANNLRLTLTLAVISVAGIIGMLLLDGALDYIALLLAASPLIVGCVRFWRHRTVDAPPSR